MALPDHSGETCIILGNGPSLATAPRDWLDHHVTFGCNYINRLPYLPTYYTCIDSTILNHNAGEIYTTASLAKLAFISSYPAPNLLLDRLRALPNIIHVGKETFQFDTEKSMSGNTAVYVALKIAFFMGFQRVMLIGVDFSQHKEHFTKDYPLGNVPAYESIKYHFFLAQTIYSENGREIVNLSAPSELDNIFPRGEKILIDKSI